jgi:hypothetical protein
MRRRSTGKKGQYPRSLIGCDDQSHLRRRWRESLNLRSHGVASARGVRGRCHRASLRACRGAASHRARRRGGTLCPHTCATLPRQSNETELPETGSTAIHPTNEVEGDGVGPRACVTMDRAISSCRSVSRRGRVRTHRRSSISARSASRRCRRPRTCARSDSRPWHR